ncbi:MULTISPECIES: O-antigen ligase family protein [unclassified Sphingomonas]|uniref:O-antigen ligase family protein n=1 Tax=Novosphingobium rhizosphaerae TaxID=1551649 RepID=UPI0015CD822E
MEESPASQPQRRSRRRRSSASPTPPRPLAVPDSTQGQRRRRSRSGSRGSSRSLRLPADIALAPPQVGVIVVMAALAVALVLGGGGTTNPGTEMILQPLVALILALPLLHPRLATGLGPVPRAAWVIAALVLIVPVLQLIPLPPAIWHALPDREMEVASLALIGQADRWMPWSMAPARTFISLLAMVVPVLMLLAVSRTDLIGRLWLCATIVAVAGASVMLGALQLSHAAGHNWTLYSYAHFGVIVGFQANHNAEADLLSIALMACGVIATAVVGLVPNRSLFWGGVAFTGAIMLVVVFLTGSRTGIALLPIALAFCAAMVWPLARQQFSRRTLWLGVGGGVAAVGLLLAVGLHSVDRIMNRFSNLNDSRRDIWIDTIHALGQVWPAGGGVGSFPPIFNAAERLEVVRNTVAGRAHNDWMEWTLEAGLPGLIVLVAVLAIVGTMAWRRLGFELREKGTLHSRAQALFALGIMAQLGVHALDDFPIREMSLASLLAMAGALLFTPRAIAALADRTPETPPLPASAAPADSAPLPQLLENV